MTKIITATLSPNHLVVTLTLGDGRQVFLCGTQLDHIAKQKHNPLPRVIPFTNQQLLSLSQSQPAHAAT